MIHKASFAKGTSWKVATRKIAKLQARLFPPNSVRSAEGAMLASLAGSNRRKMNEPRNGAIQG